ncbi:replication protein A 70 kDa DNA-binding subunit A-like [Bidens hawaiensis]|uniref:replication protein A 70 kDa DNA-binding subunit A-like n=1 Tax=Bidens hawaiensis TaxID=980011 RepID=UPI0040498125
MEVSDISGDSVYVTLWGDYVSQFSKYVVDHFDESHMIILMQFGRVKYHKEEPYVSNFYGSDVTRVFINDSISEFEDYKTRLFEFLDFNVDGVVRRPIPVKLMSTLDEEFLMATSFFNICEICTILQPKSIIVLGTIKVVCPDSEWYYVGCNSCSRKVIVTVVEGEDVYECKNQRCNTLGVTPTPRYKIKLRVQDGSGVVSLTLFDSDAKLIINKTASELLFCFNNMIVSKVVKVHGFVLDGSFQGHPVQMS